MKPGEYIGKDGKTYKYVHTEDDGFDLRAALDALIESENQAQEWVALPVTDRYQASRDGTRAQHRYSPLNEWRDLDARSFASSWPVQCYRRGLEIGLQQREAVRELVEAVENPGVHNCNALLPSVDGWERIKAAAKRVKL